MRLALFTNIPASHNRRLVAALRAAGAEVRVVYRDLPAALGRPWSPRLDDGDVLADTWRGARQAMTATTSDEHVVLTGGWAHAHELARRVALARRAASLHWWGEVPRPASRTRARAFRAWLALPGLTGVLAIGPLAAERYRTLVRPGTPVHVFPYTTDLGLSVPLDARRGDPDRPVVGYAGRFLPYKGVGVLLEAIARLEPPERPRLELAGSGPARTDLQRWAHAAGLEASWLGELDPDELAERRTAWHVQVVPSQRLEGWALTLHEALNAGVPVVSSRLVQAGVALVRDPAAGELLDAGDVARPGCWADALGAERLARSGRATERARCREIGAAFSPVRAAPWLLEVLASAPDDPRDFVAETWRRLDRRSPEPSR